MRVKWSQCTTNDPDVPAEFAFVDRSGEVLGVTRHGLQTRLVVMCDDNKAREVVIDAVRKDATDAE